MQFQKKFPQNENLGKGNGVVPIAAGDSNFSDSGIDEERLLGYVLSTSLYHNADVEYPSAVTAFANHTQKKVLERHQRIERLTREGDPG